jgi:hypothetical protein
LKSHRRSSLFRSLPRLAAGAACLLCWAAAPAAQGATLAADSTTILRLRQSPQDRDLYPLYEYLHLSGVSEEKNGAVSYYLGGWGRLDLWDRSSDEGTNGDLQYGYLSYRANRNNLQFSAGRQFITDGLASEHLDGLYLKSDLAAGFSGSLFVGEPVTTVAPGFSGGDLIYGGRLAHSLSRYYTLGVSALKSEANGYQLREEEGIDLWLQPVAGLDVDGRSSYNSATGGWMEHSYTASYALNDRLKLSALVSKINYRDFFHHVTTSALSLTNGLLDPNEEVLSVGGNLGYVVNDRLSVTGEYRRYDYELAGDADYFGAKANFNLPGGIGAGLALYRMDGEGARLKYTQLRAWGARKLGPLDLTVDFYDLILDGEINGRKNTFSLSAAAGYDVSRRLRVAADLDFLRSVDSDHEIRALVKAMYAFDWPRRGKQ